MGEGVYSVHLKMHIKMRTWRWSANSIDMEAGLALYWWQRLITFSSRRIRVNFSKVYNTNSKKKLENIVTMAKKPSSQRSYKSSFFPSKIASFSPSFNIKSPHSNKKNSRDVNALIKNAVVNNYWRYFSLWRVCWFYFKIIYWITLLNMMTTIT